MRKAGAPEDYLPRPIFEAELLIIRQRKGQNPIHVTIRWGSHLPCNDVDVLCLLKYLESKARNCHLNTGVHGKYVDGKFDYDFDQEGGDHLRQDVGSATFTKNKVSVHMVTKRDGPCYHAGVDTIDGFCFSWHKKLTEEELDRVFVDFA